MEEEATSRRSVEELAGKFKDSPRPHRVAENEMDQRVRRRPPRSLQLPMTPGDEQKSPGVTSPSPGKGKRSSALIEKLQANLALSPSALLPSPKSPGFRLLPPSFPPTPTTSVTPTPTPPTSPVATSPLTEEGPTSFEAPPSTSEGSILTSITKGRARHSMRRRPPSHHHRKSSSAEEGGGADEVEDTPTNPSDVFREADQPRDEAERPERNQPQRDERSTLPGEDEEGEEERRGQ